MTNGQPRPAYITAAGTYLPGEPVTNDEIEGRLGVVGSRPSVLKERILKANGIKTRHYALDDKQQSTHLNEELAALAIQNTLANRGLSIDDFTMLATATTQGDLPLPGFASMVHGRIGGGTMETQSIGGVCNSSMGALVAAARAVQTGAHDRAIAVASEQVSRSLKATRFDWILNEGTSRLDAEFLRWMLSDGAAALTIESEPRPDGLSLRIDWTHLASHADRHDVVMYAGMLTPQNNTAGETWLDRDTIADADNAGTMALRQDVRRIPEVLRAGAEEWVRLAHTGLLEPESVDLMLCHFSSEQFRSDVFKLMYETGMVVPEDRWFTNLHTKGNTGAASIYIILEEAFNTGLIKNENKVVLLVPESGRVSVGMAQLTAVEVTKHEETKQPAAKSAAAQQVDPLASIANSEDEVVRALLADLALVWADFERHLARIPIVRRIESGQATLDDYKSILVNLRQQVMEGARWISRAASSLSIELFPLRSAFIGHAAEEHRDFRLLEQNYVSVGGDLEVILSTPKNIGSEALSGFIFNQAAQPDPLDLLGAMFIIEGLGTRKADGWAAALKDQLSLTDDQVSFFLYHGANDDDHFDKLRSALTSGVVTSDVARRIVKTAKVTARLYALQLEELGNV